MPLWQERLIPKTTIFWASRLPGSQLGRKLSGIGQIGLEATGKTHTGPELVTPVREETLFRVFITK